MKNQHLGGLEEVLLLAVASLTNEAYAVNVQRYIEKKAGYASSMGAVYKGLDRLEEKGFLRSRLGDVTHERGGRRKRFYEITGSGRAAVVSVQAAREKMWSGLRQRPEFQSGN